MRQTDLFEQVQRAGAQLELERARPRRKRLDFGPYFEPNGRSVDHGLRERIRQAVVSLGHSPQMQGLSVECLRCGRSGFVTTQGSDAATIDARGPSGLAVPAGDSLIFREKCDGK